jgi:virulence factor Mce-like protein
MRRTPARRRDTRSTAAIVSSALVVLVLVGAYLVVTLRAPRGVPLLGYRTVTAVLPDVGNLRVHGEVRSAGVRLGEVTGVRADPGGARVRLKLDPGVGDLPAGTTAAIRGKGLLGARYVELELGTSARSMPEDAVIRPAGNPITLAVSDALDTFDADTRGGLRSTFAEMGTGFLGRGIELNDALRHFPPALADVRAVADALDRRPGAARRFVPSFAALLEPLADARKDIADGFGPTARALSPLVDERTAVRATLDEAPPALSAVESGLGTGVGLLGAVQTLAHAVNRTLPDAAPGLRATTQLLRDAPEPLSRARVLFRAVRTDLPALARVTTALSPVLAPLRHVLARLQPVVVLFGEHGCDFVDFGDNFRSAVNQGLPGGTDFGPVTNLRLIVMGSPRSLSNLGGIETGDEPFAAPCAYSLPPHTYGGTG